MFSFANAAFTFFNSHVRFKGVINKQAATSPQATTMPIPNFKFFTGSLTFQLKANDRVWTNFVYLFTC